MPRETLKNRIARKISNSRKTVFMRKDFKKLADYDQVGRTLKELTREGKLVKTAYGMYSKARTNRITGEPMLAAPGGFNEVAKACLNRLKIKWEPSAATKAYQNGSTQVPVKFQPVIKSRFSRKISYKNQTLKFGK